MEEDEVSDKSRDKNRYKNRPSLSKPEALKLITISLLPVLICIFALWCNVRVVEDEIAKAQIDIIKMKDDVIVSITQNTEAIKDLNKLLNGFIQSN